MYDLIGGVNHFNKLVIVSATLSHILGAVSRPPPSYRVGERLSIQSGDRDHISHLNRETIKIKTNNKKTYLILPIWTPGLRKEVSDRANIS